jgi:HK97 gp10 family phage protein
MIIMASKINISKLLSQIESFGYDANRLAVAVTNLTAEDIANQAKLRAPVDQGQLRQSIGKTTARVGYNVSFVFANTPYAAFVEFGTGERVAIPKGFEQMASEFRGKKSGNFDSFLDAIRGWCARKGIDPKLAYVIAVSILRKGLKPRPYFIPSYLEGIQQYPKDLRKVLEVQTRKYNAKK